MDRPFKMLIDCFDKMRMLTALTKTRAGRLFFSALFVIVSSLFEGVSIGLIVPLLGLLINKGALTSLTGIPGFGFLMNLFPYLRFRHIFFIVLFMIILCVAIKNILVYSGLLMVSSVSRYTEHVLRSRIYDRYLTFSKIFFDKNKIGELSDLASTQVINACRIFDHIYGLFFQICMLAVYFIIMLFISWKLTLASLLLIPSVSFMIDRVSKKIYASAQQKFVLDQQIGSTIYGSLSNMALIHAYTTEESESRKYKLLSEKSRQNQYSIWKKILFVQPSQEIILTAAIGVLVMVCVFILFHGSNGAPFETAAFLSFFIFLKRFSSSLSMVGTSYTEIPRALEPVNQILALFDDRDKFFIKNGHRKFEALQGGIQFENVSFAYGESKVLNQVSLSFKKGEITAIVGSTGSGKTTLVSMIPRFYDVSEGHIYLNGVDIKEYELKSLRKRLAIVSQDVQIINASIKENIIYGLEGEVNDTLLDEVAKRSQIYDFIMSLPDKYDTRVGERGVRLSGGEKQRVSIARALLKKPDLFIFDEATSSLDLETEIKIQKSIEDLTRGRTVIVIAHRLATIRNADYVVVLENGRVLEEGKFDELIKKQGKFYFYWTRQSID